MSAHASPPPVSINMAWVSTLPRSWTGRRSPGIGIRAESASPSPNRSANAPRACSPTWATTWEPPAPTTTGTTLLPCTWRVPSWLEIRTRRERQNPLPRGHFRGWATLSSQSPVNDRG
jgi:hypothetical protein